MNNLVKFSQNLVKPANVRFMAKVPNMKQVDVDDPALQQNLGKIKMGMIKKAEKSNQERAEKHIKTRRRNIALGGLLGTFAVSVYFYSMFAMKQETFLDDFVLPEDPTPEKQ